jgi:hypothetical protein
MGREEWLLTLDDSKTAFWPFGKPKRVNEREAEKLLLRAAQQVSREFQARILGTARLISSQLDKFAKQQSVDLSYVRLIFIRPTRYWPKSLNAKEKEALLLAKKIVIETSELPSVANAQQPPFEFESNVDKALIDMARWVKAIVIPKLQDAYYFDIVPKIARPLIRKLRREEDPAPPAVDVGSQVAGTFEYRLRDGELSLHRLLMYQVLTF